MVIILNMAPPYKNEAEDLNMPLKDRSLDKSQRVLKLGGFFVFESNRGSKNWEAGIYPSMNNGRGH